jgi:hypothetical protein
MEVSMRTLLGLCAFLNMMSSVQAAYTVKPENKLEIVVVNSTPQTCDVSRGEMLRQLNEKDKIVISASTCSRTYLGSYESKIEILKD